jgi:hypothetical protein
MKLISILCLFLSLAVPTAAAPKITKTNAKNCEPNDVEEGTGIGKTRVRKIKPCCYVKKLLKFYDDAVSMMALPCVLLLLLVMLTIHLTSSTCIPKPAGPNLL